MGHWPQGLAVTDPPVHIHSYDSLLEAAGDVSGTIGSVVWPTANTAIFIPFRLAAPATVRKLFWMNGSIVSGNVDAGIYDKNGVRLVSSGSTLQSGANVNQSVDVTDTVIGPGNFYLALAMDNITGTIEMTQSYTVEMLRIIGLAQQATAFALPATATFATVLNARLPACGAVVELASI